VVESERNALIKCGRSDLAEMVRHVAKLEGDGAGYDIKSYTPEGEEKFIDVKTTQGDRSTAFYLSSNEVRFAADHAIAVTSTALLSSIKPRHPARYSCTVEN